MAPKTVAVNIQSQYISQTNQRLSTTGSAEELKSDGLPTAIQQSMLTFMAPQVRKRLEVIMRTPMWVNSSGIILKLMWTK